MKKILSIAMSLALGAVCISFAACQKEEGYDPGLTVNGYADSGRELVEYDKAYAPFWEGDTVYNESVVFVKGEDGVISTKTMFEPTKVLEVRDSTLQTVYEEGKDYTYADGVFTLPEGSSIPYFTYNQVNYNQGAGITTLTEEEKADLVGIDVTTYGVMWTEGAAIAMRQVEITYRHDPNDWAEMDGFNQTWQGDILDTTLSKLEKGDPVEILLYGDSITSVNAQGTGASSAGIGREPYFPCWAQGFEDALNFKYDSDITVYNLGEGGWTTYQGVLYADGKLNAHSPDLFVIAFGMNDATNGITVAQYKSNIQTMIDMVRATNPAAEVILVSTTHRNMSMVWPKNSVRHEDLLPVIYELAEENENTAVLDMTSFTESLFSVKASYECFYNNINHPIDYMVRAYVANMMKLFLK